MALAPGTYATFNTSEGKIVTRLFEAEAPITTQNLSNWQRARRSGRIPERARSRRTNSSTARFSSRDSRLHDPGRRSDRNRHGWPGLPLPGRNEGFSAPVRQAGKLAMANSGPNTNGCQFFITVAPTPWLTGNHTIFGEVVEGQDIADKISKLPRGAQDKPSKPVVLESVTIERVA